MPATNQCSDRQTHRDDRTGAPAAPRLLVLLAVAGLTAWVFAEVLFAGGMFAYRDAAHFYYPLLEFTGSEWAAGRVPLWNPYENLGVPLAANPAAGVFYPGMLVFALPIGFAWAYRLYVVGHLVAAAATAYLLARRWKASRLAAGVCALSYAFSGNVLVQHANVVFLVGAAWLPLAVLATDRMLAGRSLRAALGLGAVLAMMVLGGDPQMAYNAGLLAVVYAMVLRKEGIGGEGLGAREEGRPEGDAGPPHPAAARRPSPGGRGYVLLAVAAATGLVLSAVQVVPSMELAARSKRADSEVPRSLYEIPGHLGQEDAGASMADGLLCRSPAAGTHLEGVYQFSVGPWRWCEYLWPNAGGRQYPIHRRWLDVVPAEGRVWAPTLYMGLLPVLLGLGAFRLRRGRAPQRWLSWIALLAMVGALGWFGLGWLVQEIVLACGGDPQSVPVGAPVGGLYWLMTIVLPGYVQFRYPAKLLLVAGLAWSVLASRGWDLAFAGRWPGLSRVLLGLAGLSVAMAVGMAATGRWWDGWRAGVEPDSVFGPLDVAGAHCDLLFGLLQTALLGVVFWWLLRRAGQGVRWAAMAALVLVAVDLGVANRWVVDSAPVGLWEERSRVAAAIAADAAQSDTDEMIRVYRRKGWLPPAWQASGSRDRLGEAVRWERDTLRPKYPLADRLAITEVHGTMMLADYAELLREANAAGEAKGTVPFSLREDRDSPRLGARYVVLRGDEGPPPGAGMELVLRDRRPTEDFSLWRHRDVSRVWIKREGEESSETVPGDSVHIVGDEPQYVEIEAVLSEPGLVVLADQFYPGWHLDVETAGQGSRRVSIERAGGVMRGARLPAGSHRLVYRYRPSWLRWSAAASALGWIALLGVGLRLWTASRRSKTGSRR